MYGRESIALLRDVEAIRIPEGTPVALPQGHIVTLFQSLGGNFTVTDERGNMVRITGDDADALGKEPSTLNPLEAGEDSAAVEKNVWAMMRTVFDPEIPVNIVELGLVYQCKITPHANGGHQADVVMTLTAPGCGMGPVIQQDVERGIGSLPGVTAVNVEVVFDPPWSRDMMSEAAQLQLGML
ncbi:putative Fe-S cluster assembly protein SufT [Candidatus Methylospira mobilis]|uniref:Putative Fe-S cluster assembly protein SufT n=1 Tax=Candidatus Methylospira mobilis TaxID=1808979 RepID=A0A5Q0BNL8_9GAMM|nr:putative Fe-S cluster assembly protein SufT [Candidatus Methylospira mobilis]QFY43698.1 putative Fe-S cluster assembly protein SufT [Candidatus Methylospira mobilis]WNV04688.1 putative Fe-S cluster assembly protein SufT [Candidatus Methylospira mobilis]